MNNRFKFRIWDSGRQKFVYPDDFDLLGAWFTIVGLNKRGYTIQQFTGLRDSNKKDIYEGDICKAFKANSYLNGNYEVIWDERHGRWSYKASKYQVGNSGNLKCEVIGNIFENKKQ